MALRFTCKKCSTPLKVPEEQQGRCVTCPKCGMKQVVLGDGVASADLTQAATDETPEAKLRSHVFRSYMQLRVGMAIIALIFPVILLLGGSVLPPRVWPPLGSMSAYYHTVIGDFFVGLLFALGAFLILYKGFSRQENYVLNVAGVLAILIAAIPTDQEVRTPPVMVEHHGQAVVDAPRARRSATAKRTIECRCTRGRPSAWVSKSRKLR